MPNQTLLPTTTPIEHVRQTIAGGAPFDVCDYDSVVRWLDEVASEPNGAQRTRYVCVANVADVMDARKDPAYAAALDASDLVVPDGKPIVWSLRRAGHDIQKRVYGPTLMQLALDDPAIAARGHMLIAGTPAARRGVRERFPDVNWVGEVDFRFDHLTDDDYARLADQISAAAPSYVWVSLGGGKQVRFMHRISALAPPCVMLGVGAALDFHAGLLPQAPSWMQERGLEWLFRLGCEPRRLWRRYLVHNPPFLYHLLTQKRARAIETPRQTERSGADVDNTIRLSSQITRLEVKAAPMQSAETTAALLTANPPENNQPAGLEFGAASEVYEQARPRLIIALPAYNEEGALAELLDGIGLVLAGRGVEYHILVVDDGSSDATAAIASQATFRLPLTLIEHQSNGGLAVALRTCLQAAAELARPGDIIVTMDADNTHPPGLILRMMDLVREGRDVVIASRFERGAQVHGVPVSRVAMSIAARWVFTLAFPIRGVRDYTCGYRAYRANVVQQALAKHGDRFISERGFSCMVDVLLKLRREGLIMGEAPLILRYDRKQGPSKMHVLRTVMQTLSLIVRRRLGG